MAKREPRSKIQGEFTVQIRKLARELGAPQKMTWVRTGIHAFDLMLGNGVPLGRIIELFGEESTGKSMLGWEIAKAFQRRGGVVVCMDVEATTPRKFIRNLGVNFDRLIYHRPTSFEDVQQFFFEDLAAIRSINPDIKILFLHDTVAATTSKSEWEYDKKLKRLIPKETAQPGTQARAMSRFLKHISPYISEGNCTYLAINQVREKIGVMWGDKTTTPGGKALRFYSGIRIQLNRGRKIESKDGKAIGVVCNAFVKKNKCSEPFRKAPLRILWKKGFDPCGGLPEILEDVGRIKKGKAGRWSIGNIKFRAKDISTIVSKKKELIKAIW